MAMNLLIIDDEQSVRDSLCETIPASGDFECRACDFNDAKHEIKRLAPDIVVLDLLLQSGPPEHTDPAKAIDEFIWSHHFCPIIVHSAAPEHYSDEHKNHPFVRVIKKGRDSLKKVVEELNNFAPHIQALRNARQEIETSVKTSLSLALRDVAPQIFDDMDSPRAPSDKITHAGKRRLAALLEGDINGGPLAPWEMYLCPPMSRNIQLGDILMKINKEDDLDNDCSSRGPSDFYVVLTPSCDLVSNDAGQDLKVHQVLLAKCDSMKNYLPSELTRIKPSKRKGRIKTRLLTPGHLNGVVPFPSYRNKIPTMATNMRDLELVPIENIGENSAFRRIASIDSPFRESLAWAYLQIAGRPGVPDRDFDSWSHEIDTNIDSDSPSSE